MPSAGSGGSGGDSGAEVEGSPEELSGEVGRGIGSSDCSRAFAVWERVPGRLPDRGFVIVRSRS